MNWLIFALLAWLMAGMELGLRDALQIGNLALAPSFVMILLVFVALWARPQTALGVGLSLGALLDLLYVLPTQTGETAVLMGPWALGCTLAAYTVLNFRALMFRKNPLTMAFLCAVATAIANVIVLAILALRAFYDPILLPSATSELWQRLGTAVYTGVVALAVGPALQTLAPWLGFRRQTQLGGRFA
ncbi:MAG: hypothetical protein SFZ24_10965 [Planctomycetota bacterium]|nr:hypothetical protein [Planctomycetota bacterium]